MGLFKRRKLLVMGQLSPKAMQLLSLEQQYDCRCFDVVLRFAHGSPPKICVAYFLAIFVFYLYYE